MLSMAIAAVRENNPPLIKGRQPTKFTPNNIARIKEWVAQGVCRDDIANRLEVTVNSLQVTCSKLGLSLRKRSLANGAIPPVGVVQRSTENIRHVDDSARLKCKLLIQKQGKQAEFELPLHQGLMEQLALEASVRGQSVISLIGTIVSQVVRKDLVAELLRNDDAR
jgi:hypothetical protein